MHIKIKFKKVNKNAQGQVEMRSKSFVLQINIHLKVSSICMLSSIVINEF